MEVAVGLSEHGTSEMSRPVGPWTRLNTTQTPLKQHETAKYVYDQLDSRT